MKNILLYSTLLLSISTVNAAFITPTSVTASQASSFGIPNDLITDATNTSYIAPNPSGGGGGTSNWTSSDFNTWTFNFDSTYSLNTLYLWDYYGHSSANWELNFFDGSGNNLGTKIFSIAPGAPATSTFNEINFTEMFNVLSINLENTSLSTAGGVGLSEVHFGGSATTIPAPTAIFLFASGLIGLLGKRIKLNYHSKATV